jgi:hypothetical protein
LEFRDLVKGFASLRNIMVNMKKGLTIVTNAKGHRFSNMTNHNITLTISYPIVVVSKSLSQHANNYN